MSGGEPRQQGRRPPLRPPPSPGSEEPTPPHPPVPHPPPHPARTRSHPLCHSHSPVPLGARLARERAGPCGCSRIAALPPQKRFLSPPLPPSRLPPRVEGGPFVTSICAIFVSEIFGPRRRCFAPEHTRLAVDPRLQSVNQQQSMGCRCHLQSRRLRQG